MIQVLHGESRVGGIRCWLDTLALGCTGSWCVGAGMRWPGGAGSVMRWYRDTLAWGYIRAAVWGVRWLGSGVVRGCGPQRAAMVSGGVIGRSGCWGAQDRSRRFLRPASGLWCPGGGIRVTVSWGRHQARVTTQPLHFLLVCGVAAWYAAGLRAEDRLWEDAKGCGMKPHFDCSWCREAACDVDVGLIYRDAPEWMGSIIRMLPASADGLRMRVLLLDNASPSGTAEWDELWEPTTVLRNPRPLGFAENMNRLLAASTAPYLAVFDPCLQFLDSERVLARLVRFMEGQPRCGVCTCRVYRPDGSYAHPARRFPGLRGLAVQCLNLGWPCSRVLAEQCYGERPRDATYACDWVTSTCMVLRRCAGLAVGGFDGRLCPGLAEAEFALRLAAAGWQVKFHGAAWCQMRALPWHVAHTGAWQQVASAVRYLVRRQVMRWAPGAVRARAAAWLQGRASAANRENALSR